MTTQEFLSQVTDENFSAETQQEIRTIIGTATEMTPELAEQLSDCLERDIENDLKDVTVDPAAEAALEQELSTELSRIEGTTKLGYETVGKNLQELAEMSQKVDVLERLHTSA